MAANHPIRFIAVTRLERSVLSELAGSFGVAVFAMTIVTLIGGVYGPVRDGLPLSALVQFLPLIVLYMLPWTIPTAFVGACIITYGRMASCNELTAVRASGIHVWRILTPAAALATALCAVCGVLNHAIVPITAFYQYGIGKSSKPSQIAAALQYSDPVMTIGPTVVHVREFIGTGRMRDLILVSKPKQGVQSLPSTSSPDPGRPKGEPVQVITYVYAPWGSYEYSDERGEIVFYLENDPTRNTVQEPHGGDAFLCKSVYSGAPHDFELLFFKNGVYPIKLESMEDLKFLPQKGKHMTTAELLLKIDLREDQLRWRTQEESAMSAKLWKRWQDEPRHWRVAIHSRSALSLAPLLLGLVAVPLGVLTRRGRRLTGFGLAIAIVLGGYYPLMAGGSALGESGKLPPAAAIWMTSVLIAVLGILLIRNMLKR